MGCPTVAREIAKANSSLAQKEWEEAFLQDWLIDLERHICKIMNKRWLNGGLFGQCGQGLSEAKQADINKLTLKMQDMKKGANEWKKREIDLETKLDQLKVALDRKLVSLVELEAEVRKASKEHQVMRGEIKDLKQESSEEVDVNLVNMDQLICDLESTKQAIELANIQLKELQGKL